MRLAPLLLLLTLCLATADRLPPNPSKGCREPGSTPAPRHNTITFTIRVPNRHNASIVAHRTFQIRLPTTYTPGVPAPLLLLFHGRGDMAFGWDAGRYDSLADAHGHILVQPEGMHDYEGQGDPTAYSAFNVGDVGQIDHVCDTLHTHSLCYTSCRRLGKCGPCSSTTCYDDIAMVNMVIDFMESNLCIDTGRLYASGVGNGAQLIYHMLNDVPRFAAVVPISGLPFKYTMDNLKLSEEAKHTSILHLHNIEDRMFPYQGGPGIEGGTHRRFYYTSLEDTLFAIAVEHSCSGSKKAFDVDPKDPIPGLDCMKYHCEKADVARCLFRKDPIHDGWFSKAEELTFAFITRYSRNKDDHPATPTPTKATPSPHSAAPTIAPEQLPPVAIRHPRSCECKDQNPDLQLYCVDVKKGEAGNCVAPLQEEEGIDVQKCPYGLIPCTSRTTPAELHSAADICGCATYSNSAHATDRVLCAAPGEAGKVECLPPGTDGRCPRTHKLCHGRSIVQVRVEKIPLDGRAQQLMSGYMAVAAQLEYPFVQLVMICPESACPKGHCPPSHTGQMKMGCNESTPASVHGSHETEYGGPGYLMFDFDMDETSRIKALGSVSDALTLEGMMVDGKWTEKGDLKDTVRKALDYLENEVKVSTLNLALWPAEKDYEYPNTPGDSIVPSPSSSGNSSVWVIPLVLVLLALVALAVVKRDLILKLIREVRWKALAVRDPSEAHHRGDVPREFREEPALPMSHVDTGDVLHGTSATPPPPLVKREVEPPSTSVIV